MQTVTVSFKNSRNQDQTATFDVYDVATLEKAQIRELNTQPSAFYLGSQQWSEDDWVSLKLAADAAGLHGKRVILIEK
jgi:hypothetical protein